MWMDVDGCGWMWMDVDGCGWMYGLNPDPGESDSEPDAVTHQRKANTLRLPPACNSFDFICSLDSAEDTSRIFGSVESGEQFKSNGLHAGDNCEELAFAWCVITSGWLSDTAVRSTTSTTAGRASLNGWGCLRASHKGLGFTGLGFRVLRV
jgi:hypothetical protein